MLRKAIISDLDGTLCLHQNRSPYNRWRCHTDLPNTPVVETVRMAKAAGNEVIIVSGREDDVMDMSIQWLRKYDVPFDKIFMRKLGDKRNDALIKREIYDGFIKDEYDVLFVLDDRDRVVKMWREVPLTCYQVAYGNF